MRIKQSYDEEFSCLMLDMKDKYPKALFDLNGINDENLDQTKFAKNYFTKKNVSDITPDSNANVQIKNVATFNEERHKGLDKLNSLFVFWKTARKLYNLNEANRLIEKEINKDLNIQDCSNFYMPYSYYGQTPVLIKINGHVKYWTMKQLYESFSFNEKYIDKYNMYEINTTDIYSKYNPLDVFVTTKNCTSMPKIERMCSYVGEVTEKIDVKIWDRGVWVDLNRIIKHKHEDDKSFIIYQTNQGDFAFVTEDHPVILSDGSEKLAKYLQEGDVVLKDEKLPEYNPTINIPKDIAYITGFILGDGNVGGYSKNWDYIRKHKLGEISPNIRLCRGNNTIMLYQKDIYNSSIKKIVEKAFPTVNFYTLGSNTDRKLGFTSQAYSILYGDYFNCGIKSNSFSKRLPENILNWDESSFLSLLGGLIDSDGTISNGRIDITLCSYAIINELYDLLKVHGFKNVYKRLRIEKNNKLGNNFIFSVSFRADEKLIDCSEKIKIMDVSFFNFNQNMDSRKRDNSISKIIKLKKSEISTNSFLYQEIDYVYDVTTETGTFNANGMVQHNCFNFDTYDILNIGLPFVTNFPSDPPKHSDTFWQHTVQLLQYSAPQLMGATGIGNFLIIYSSLLKFDSEDEDYPIPDHRKNKTLFERYTKQRLQELIYTLNQPLRKVQSTFTNITIYDKFFLKEVCSYYLVKDNLIDIDFVMYIQKMFINVLNDINSKQIATFPVLTVQFKKDESGEIEDTEFLDFISETNLPFSHMNIYSDEKITAQSACCRLSSNIEDLIKQAKEENMNLIGGSISKIGSLGVTTLPLARMALKSNRNEEEFFKLIEENVDDALKINHCRRYLINEKIEQNQMPLYTYGYMSLNNQYSTLGINGLYEALYFMGYDIKTEEGVSFGKKITTLINTLCQEKIKKYGYKINCEVIPAEQTASKLAKADKILYKQNDFEIYGNQFIPLVVESSIYDRIELQAEFEKYFDGGTILHINSAEKIPTKKIMKKLIQDIVKSGVKYFAINYFFSKCIKNHIVPNTGDVCKICGEEIVERYSRIVGFLVPYSSFSEERRKEFDQRKKYNIN